MIKAIIFDLDNTLYNYDRCNELAEKKLIQMVSKDLLISQEVARNLLKNAKKNIKNQLGDDVAASHNRLLYMQNICEQMEANPLIYAMKFYNCYWETMLEEMRPFDYVIPLFKKIHDKGLKIAILTDLTAHIQYRKLDKLGICDYIDCIVTSEEAGAEKPSNRMFELALKKLQVEQNEALMVGDSVKKDIEGAKQCNIRGILFETENRIKEDIENEINNSSALL